APLYKWKIALDGSKGMRVVVDPDAVSALVQRNFGPNNDGTGVPAVIGYCLVLVAACVFSVSQMWGEAVAPQLPPVAMCVLIFALGMSHLSRAQTHAEAVL